MQNFFANIIIFRMQNIREIVFSIIYSTPCNGIKFPKNKTLKIQKMELENDGGIDLKHAKNHKHLLKILFFRKK